MHLRLQQVLANVTYLSMYLLGKASVIAQLSRDPFSAIGPLRSHGMKKMGLSRTEWTSPGWPSLAVGLEGATPGAMPRVWPSSQFTTTTAGERLSDRHMSGGRRPPGPANVGVTEDRGQVVWRIKQELK